MSASRLILIVLASSANLVASANISWSGSSNATVKSTASAYYTSFNGTTVGRTGPTGTGTGANSTITTVEGCSVTTTSTIYTSSIITTGPISTVTYFGAGPIVDGDALTPVDGTATASLTGFTTTTIQETTTLTVVTFPATTVGNPSTITVPPPTDFLPVQSTLPNATYEYKNPCDVSTVLSTSTLFRIFEGPAVTTLSGTIIYFSVEQTYYPASAFRNFSIAYSTTTTYTATEYLGTATTTSAADITNTFTATTTTVYEACATDNFADSVVVDYLPQQITFFETLSSSNQTFSGLSSSGNASPFDCCNYAFSQNADVWTFAVGIGCALVTGTDGLCTPASTNDTAEVTANPGLGALQIVLGNAQCGRFTRSVPRS